MATQFSQPIIKKALETKCAVKKLDANHYLVTPVQGVYVVAFTQDKSGAVTIESCRDQITHSQCKGFRFNHGECYHGATVAIHVLKPILKVRLRQTKPARRTRAK